MNDIEWDSSISLSSKRYLSSQIYVNSIKEYYNKDNFILEEMNLTAKEWIEYEINRCKKTIEINKENIQLKTSLKKDIREIKALDKYFSKHITDLDILGLHNFND